MILSHAHRFIFIKTVKTAGTSLEVALSQLCGPDDIVTPFGRAEPGHRPQNHDGFFNHMSLAELRARPGAAAWKDYFSFAFERNPWDKVVSHYWFLQGQGVIDCDFKSFVLQAARSPSGRIALPHSRHLYLIEGKISVDHVGRYEKLDQELASISERIGVDIPPLPQAKGGYRQDPRPFSAFYDEETATLVGEAFAFEIEAFGYRLED